MASDLVDALNQVFAGAPQDMREQLIAWAGEELGSRAILTMVTDEAGATWRVGEPSPSNKETTVFALLLDVGARAVDAYTFGMVDGQGVLYFKETVWQLAHTYGPISIEALYLEWRAFFTNVPIEPAPPDDEPEDHSNGARA
jgi:hypothetical protein